MLSIVEKTITKYNMINENDNIICAVSGGADSVCLLYILNSIKYKFKFNLYAAHLNHMLRGDESEEDTLFVKELCKKLSIPLKVKYVDIKKVAKEENISEEMAGRNMRYAFFSEVSSLYKNSKIAIAHNKNDNAETVLLNLFRGTGIMGLCGITYTRDNIIRPLLDVSREEIEEYLRQNNISYRFDSSNNSLDYQRNRIRNVILLEAQKINPNVVDQIVKCANFLKEDKDFIYENVDKFPFTKINDEKIVFSIKKFNNIHKSLKGKVILKALSLLKIKDPSEKMVLDILDIINKSTGRRKNLPNGFIVEKSYDNLLIYKEEETKNDDKKYTIKVGETLKLDNNKIHCFILEGNDLKNQENLLKKEKNIIILDFDKTGDDFYLRKRKNGDFFYPSGMNHKKKLKDFFIDEKIPRYQRDLICVLEGRGDIMAILPYRADFRFTISKSTKKAIVFKFN